MSSPYVATGRTAQKARTQDALVAATRRLLAAGVTPTVEQAAAQAGVSRTTAYRYFPNRRALLLAAHPETEWASLLGDDAPAGAEQRLEVAVARLGDLVLDSEPELRTMLRLSLEPDLEDRERLPLRQGRAIGWLEEALSPLRGRLSHAEVRRLALSVRTACGIEALVWLTDVAGLGREEAVDVMRWSARAILRGALAEARPGGG